MPASPPPPPAPAFTLCVDLSAPSQVLDLPFHTVNVCAILSSLHSQPYKNQFVVHFGAAKWIFREHVDLYDQLSAFVRNIFICPKVSFVLNSWITKH